MESVRKQLIRMADAEYREFSSALVPEETHMLGVRLPELRKLAKSIAKEDWKSFLRNAGDTFFEEVMLQGMVIGYLQTDIEEQLTYVADFVPKIRNWSICDSFCAGLKCAKKHPERVWSFLKPYFSSVKEFELRFGLVMALNYFVDTTYIDAVFSEIAKVELKTYYAQMAAAWALSVCFVGFPEKTMEFLKQGRLDPFTYQKTLSKIIESNRVDSETKQKIRDLKKATKKEL